jgi:hypothetical protein
MENVLDKLLINLFGAPSSGKSVMAAEIFVALKKRGYDIECPSEFAKDIVMDQSQSALSCQPYIMGNQIWRIERCFNAGAKIVVTDSPPLLSCAYNQSKWIEGMAYEFWEKYPSLNFMMMLGHRFQDFGRVHTKAQALEIEGEILAVLSRLKINHYRIDPLFMNTDTALTIIMDQITQWHKSNENSASYNA